MVGAMHNPSVLEETSNNLLLRGDGLENSIIYIHQGEKYSMFGIRFKGCCHKAKSCAFTLLVRPVTALQ